MQPQSKVKRLVSGECFYTGLDRATVASIQRDLTLPNPRYQQALAFGRSHYATANIPRTLQFHTEPAPGVFCVPRGFRKVSGNLIEKVSVSSIPANYPPVVLSPRKWQKQVISEWKMHRMDAFFDGCVVADPGQGKSICGLMLAAAMGLKCLVVVHTEQIMRAWLDDCKLVFDNMVKPGIVKGTKREFGECVTIAMIQTLRNMPAENWAREFGMVIADECFPAGTMVDNKPIETYQPGDFVNCYDHKNNKVVKRKVLGIFKTPVRKLVRLKFSNGKVVICTEGHPFYSAGKYIPAAELTSGSPVHSIGVQGATHATQEMGNQLPLLRESHVRAGEENTRLRTDGREGTASDMLSSVQVVTQATESQSSINSTSGVQSQVCVCENDQAQSNARSVDPCESASQAKSDWTHAAYSRRKWKRTNHSAKIARVCVGVEDGIPCADQSARERLSDLLQAGYCGACPACGDRSGRGIARSVNTAETGSEKRFVLDEIRVESVEILEQESAGGYGSLCAGGYVYNLHVEDHENYFAEGILVHNCHRFPALTYFATLKACEAAFRVGLTATMDRQDGLGNLIHWMCGPMRVKAERDEAAAVPLKVIRIKTGIQLHTRSEASDKDFPQPTLWLRQMRSRVRVRQIVWLANFVVTQSKVKGPLLIVTNRVELSEDLQNQLQDIGCEHFHAGLDTQERIDFLSRAKAGKVPVTIATAGMLAEGVNVPIWTHLIVTQSYSSPILARQILGRVERAHPTKTKGFLYHLVDDNKIVMRQFEKCFQVYRKVAKEFDTLKLTQPDEHGECKLLRPIPKA
jgi:superfamily II DNA or RNA helicase